MNEPSYNIEYGPLVYIGKRRNLTRAEFVRSLMHPLVSTDKLVRRPEGTATGSRHATEDVAPSPVVRQRGLDATSAAPKDGTR